MGVDCERFSIGVVRLMKPANYIRSLGKSRKTDNQSIECSYRTSLAVSLPGSKSPCEHEISLFSYSCRLSKSENRAHHLRTITGRNAPQDAL